MTTPELRIVRADRRHLADLSDLLERIEAEDHPDEPAKAQAAVPGLQESLHHFPSFPSDCTWPLIAYVGDQPAGLAVLARVTKLDARRGFLYLDELHVLEPYRRRGIGTALLEASFALARELGLCGVRLLTRIDNEPARKLYECVGFEGLETVFYLRHFDRPESQA
jgi:ribosomal protein S18 acetylase RimI-like enzyme